MTIPIEDTADEVRSRPDTEDENISVTRPMLYERSEMELQVTLELLCFTTITICEWQN